MGKLLKRRITAVHNLQPELDARVHRVSNLVTSVSTVPLNASGVPTNPVYNDHYVGANEVARMVKQDIIKYTDIINDTTTGGTTKPASAEAVKNLQLQIDGMANGLEYIGTFDASTGAFPSNVKQGNFWKVNVSGTVLGVVLTVGDMLIANKIVSGSTTAADFDVIDNTEAADILRDGDVSTDKILTVDSDKLPTRLAVSQAIADAVAAVSVKVKVETLTISGNQFTLSQTPLSGVVFMDEAIIEIDATNGVYDTWEGITIVGKVATLSGASAVQYDSLSAKVTYLYI